MDTNEIKQLFITAQSLVHENKFADAIPLLLQAGKAAPTNADIAFITGNAYRNLHDYAMAVSYYRYAITQRADFFAAHCNLGAALRELKCYDEALVTLEFAVTLHPSSVEVLCNIGLLLCDMGQLKKATDYFRKAVSLQPKSLRLITLCADTYLALRDIDNARAVVEQGLTLTGTSPDLLCRRGMCALRTNDLPAAKGFYYQALQLEPRTTEAHFQLGNIMREWNHLEEALRCYSNVLKFQANHREALVNAGETYQILGEIDRSEECFRMVLTIDPECRLAHHNLLVSMNYNSRHSPDTIISAHLKWGDRCTPAVTHSWHAIDRTSGRRLKIGYLSPDFCNHPAAAFLEPMLRYHSPQKFDVYCYVQTIHIDEMTKMLKSLVSHWKTVELLSDDDLYTLIRNDGIDILVDTAGHFGGNRLEVFARKAAPLQISGIGYPGTTGLATIDYRISDKIIDPPEVGRSTVEKPLLAENGFCCYSPPHQLPPITPLPMLTNKTVTFGSLHTTARLNRETIDLWSLVLRAIPDAQLIICRNTLTPMVIARLSQWFTDGGISLSKIRFYPTIPATGHLTVYNDIDISLDTVPWSGHTTACESLVMGVPIVTLCGTRHAGRMVSSILTFLKLTELVATDETGYIAAAKNLADDAVVLSNLRSALRSRMMSSSLCDGKAYMQSLEEKYRVIWNEWCMAH